MHAYTSMYDALNVLWDDINTTHTAGLYLKEMFRIGRDGNRRSPRDTAEGSNCQWYQGTFGNGEDVTNGRTALGTF